MSGTALFGYLGHLIIFKVRALAGSNVIPETWQLHVALTDAIYFKYDLGYWVREVVPWGSGYRNNNAHR